MATKKKKQVKISAAENKQKVEEIKEAKKALVSGRDAVVLINVFSPDNEAKEYKIRIPNVVGNSSPSNRSPSYIAGVIIGALKAKYGNKVK